MREDRHWDTTNLFEAVETLPSLSGGITDAGWINVSQYGFSREYGFVVRGVQYVIECWANMGYLLVGELSIPFHSFKFTNTWPNKYKNNLQFRYFKNVCAILPVEEYEEEG